MVKYIVTYLILKSASQSTLIQTLSMGHGLPASEGIHKSGTLDWDSANRENTLNAKVNKNADVNFLFIFYHNVLSKKN